MQYHAELITQATPEINRTLNDKIAVWSAKGWKYKDAVFAHFHRATSTCEYTFLLIMEKEDEAAEVAKTIEGSQ